MLIEHEVLTMECKLASELGLFAENVCVVGSTLICGKGNDVDFLCLLGDTSVLKKKGFEPDLEEDAYPSDFSSWRRENTNVIAVHDRGFFLSEVAIAHAAKLAHDGDFGLKSRDGRVQFHKRIRDAVSVRLDAQPETVNAQLPF